MVEDKRELFYLYNYINWDERSKLERLVRKIASVFLNVYTLEGKLDGIVFFNTTSRKDYLDLYNEIYNSCHREKTIASVKKTRGINIYNLKNMIRYLGEFRLLDKIETPSETGETKYIIPTFFEKIMIYLTLVENKGIVHSFGKQDFSRVKAVFCLLDSWIMEWCMIRCANEKGIRTICGQHGIYPSDVNLFDAINYWRSPSSEVLVWGEVTKKNFEVYSPNTKCVICGNPLINEEMKEKDNELWAVVADQKKFHEYNQKMIEIVCKLAENNNKRVIIRLHPGERGKEDTYGLIGTNVEFGCCTDKASTVFGHTSTMLPIYMRMGYRTYKYRSDIKGIDIDEKNQFSSMEELDIKIKTASIEGTLKQGKMFFKYVGEGAKLKYKEYFDSI